VKQALSRLRVETDWFSPPERILAETTGMRYLRGILTEGTVTELLFEDRDSHIIGMTAVPQPHSTWKEQLLTLPPDSGDFEQFAMILSRLHGGSYNNRTLGEVFGDTRYFESMRLRPYYEFTARQVPDARNPLENLTREALGHKLCLCTAIIVRRTFWFTAANSFCSIMKLFTMAIRLSILDSA
jgi:5-methylthioribose kinase